MRCKGDKAGTLMKSEDGSALIGRENGGNRRERDA